MSDRWMLLVFIGICLSVEFLSGLATQQSVSGWYVELRKPSWTPPSWLFPVVWTVLYIAMGVAAWLVWRERGIVDVRWPLTLFFTQLLFNGLWSLLFFGLQRPAWGLIDIVLLWLALAVTLVLFWRLHALAGVLLLPYLLWVSYATALNAAIWRMNS